MRGKWVNFDDETLVAEAFTVPAPDRGALFHAMDRYAKGDDAGWTVKSYGSDLFMLKKGKLSGRSLFFTVEDTDPPTLVLLLIYKKEGQEAPERILATARQRRGEYINRRRE